MLKTSYPASHLGKSLELFKQMSRSIRRQRKDTLPFSSQQIPIYLKLP